MTNPNVPANQADAAKTSAPDAKVMPSQPAQLPQTGQTAASQPAQAQPMQPAAQTAVPVDGAMRSTAPQDPKMTQQKSGDLQSQQEKEQNLKTTRDEEQQVGKELDQKNAKSDYFQEVANNDEVFNDVFREQARQERLREAEMAKGDPTRDPVAKQEAMDMNTPAPGAKEEAEQIRSGEDDAKRSQ